MFIVTEYAALKISFLKQIIALIDQLMACLYLKKRYM